MRIEKIPTMNILDIEKDIGKELVVRERGVPGLPKFYASFEDVEVKEGPCLASTFGNGCTPEEAIRDYCREISNQTIVVDAMLKSRVEKRLGHVVYEERK